MGQTLSPHKEIKSDFCFATLKGNVILKYVFFRQGKKKENFKLQDFGPMTITHMQNFHLTGSLE